MDISKSIFGRFSCRYYKDKKIKDKYISRILEAGLNAPNSGNLQACKFIVINNSSVKEKITKASLDQRWMMQAPVFVVICSNSTKLKTYYHSKYELYSIQDTSLAAENMMLMAFSFDIKSCFVSAFDDNAIRRILKLPDEVNPYCIITLGYSKEKKTSKRGSLNYSVNFNEY